MKNKLYILLFLAFLFSGTALWAQQKATPKAGEGISAFLLIVLPENIWMIL